MLPDFRLQAQTAQVEGDSCDTLRVAPSHPSGEAKEVPDWIKINAQLNRDLELQPILS